MKFITGPFPNAPAVQKGLDSKLGTDIIARTNELVKVIATGLLTKGCGKYSGKSELIISGIKSAEVHFRCSWVRVCRIRKSDLFAGWTAIRDILHHIQSSPLNTNTVNKKFWINQTLS